MSPAALRPLLLQIKDAVSGSPTIVPRGKGPNPQANENLLNHDCTITAMPQYSPPHHEMKSGKKMLSNQSFRKFPCGLMLASC